MNPLLLVLVAASPAPLHVHVEGDGYFRFARGTQGVYSNDANLVNLNGLLCNADGLPLLPQTHLAPGGSFSIQMDGTVVSAGKQAGRLVLAELQPNALQKSGKYWVAISRSQIGFPGEGVLGIIKVGLGSSSISAPIGAAAQKTVSSSTVEISLKTEIDKPDIMLGDIATVQGNKTLEDQIANVDLGATPVFGAPRGITRVYVIAAMKHAGIDTDKLTLLCPSGAFVIRKGQKVDADAMIDAAKTGIKKQLGIDEDVKSDRMISDMWVPTGQLTFNTIQAISVGDGYTVNIEIDVDGKMITRRTIGLTPTTPSVRVHVGDPIKIRVIKNGASVEVEGKIRTAGKVGSPISVQSEAGATFTGTLVSPSLVEVKL